MKSFKQTFKEDIQPGYAPKEISFGGYTTKNLHHSADATQAFASTIDKVKRGEIRDKEGVLHALKATDTYMKINDMHLEQGKAPDEAELETWRNAHIEARNHLNKIGEFMHHMDYWHNHEHEIQDMETEYNPETAGAEMADSYEPQGDQINESATRFIQKVNAASKAYRAGRHDNAKMHLDNARSFMLGVKSTDMRKIKDAHDTYKDLRKKYAVADSDQQIKEELTDKTIKSSDRVKVARMIADMLGVENAEALSPDNAVNQGLRKIKTKRMTPEFVSTVKKMVQLANEVGIKVDTNLLPKAVTEAKDDVVVDKNSTYNAAKGILRYKDFAKLSKVNQGVVPMPAPQSNSGSVFGEDSETAPEKDEEDTVQNIPTQVGSSMQHPSDDHLRRRKVVYKTEEVESVEEQSIDYDTEKHKDKMDQQVKKASLILRHSRERQAMAARHHSQKVAVTEESEEDFDFDEDELEKMASSVSNEDHILDEYDDEDLVIIDQDTGEIVDDLKEEVESLQEVLSRSERLKAKIRFARTSSKRERRLQVALRTRSSTPKINQRARRLAVKLMKQRIARKPVGQMTVSEKERAERIIQRRKAVINRLAMKLAPRIRRIENDRLSGHKGASPKVGV